jgi:hypothetical protein
MRTFVGQLLRFALIEANACAFAVALFAGLAASSVVPLPIPRYEMRAGAPVFRPGVKVRAGGLPGPSVL